MQLERINKVIRLTKINIDFGCFEILVDAYYYRDK